MIHGMRLSREVGARPSSWIDCAVVYGAFLGTFSLAFWIVRHVPRSETAGIALDLIPYLVIFAVTPFSPSAALGLCSGKRRSCGFWQPGSQRIRPIGTGLSGRTRWGGESTPSSQTLWKRRLPRNSGFAARSLRR